MTAIPTGALLVPMRSAAPLHRFALFALVLLLTFAPSGGLGCSGEPASPPVEAASTLRLRFPDQAAKVLEQNQAFVGTEEGFMVRASAGAGAWRHVEVELPRDGGGTIRLRTGGGFEARVRALGMEGEGALAEQAVAYRRAGGISFWTAVPGGVEEWLHLDAGVARGSVAAWEIEGAEVRQRGDAVEVIDGDGVARLRVTAPIAYAAGGREVKTRLEGRGTRIELSVDAGGEEVLVDPEWVTADSMNTARYTHTATLLNDGTGRVLVAGGYDNAFSPVDTVELYDPEMNTWTDGPAMTAVRAGHTATLLDDGRVLVTGGFDLNDYLDSAEIYSPTTNDWTPAPPMGSTRGYHTATPLAGGQVLVAGGTGTGNVVLASAELYDSTMGDWMDTAPMGAARNLHTATPLTDGRVLVTGGVAAAALNSAEIYDPVASSWITTVPPPMSQARASHTATPIAGDRVLVAGGDDAIMGLNSAELYDVQNNTWSAAPPMGSSRTAHSATLLVDGTVLVAGGADAMFSPLDSAELYDAQDSSWTPVPTVMSAVRYQHTATRLAGGQVLIAGGFAASPLASAELYILPAGSPCTAPGACESGFCVNEVCCDMACTGACMACSVMNGAPADGTCGPAAAGTVCGGAASCNGGTVTSAELCDVNGTCQPAVTEGCGDYACADGACLTACESVAQCAAPGVCQEVSCNSTLAECALFQKLDNTPCPGGICIAGGCFTESSSNSSGGGSGMGGSGGEGGAGMSGSGSTTTGAGVVAGGNADGSDGEPQFHGGGCAVGRGPAPRALWLGLGLLVAFARRRHGKAAPRAPRARSGGGAPSRGRSCDARPGSPELG